MTWIHGTSRENIYQETQDGVVSSPYISLYK